jgi:hypothetical protein
VTICPVHQHSCCFETKITERKYEKQVRFHLFKNPLNYDLSVTASQFDFVENQQKMKMWK